MDNTDQPNPSDPTDAAGAADTRTADAESADHQADGAQRGISRRRLLLGGAGLVGAGALGVAAVDRARADGTDDGGTAHGAVDFYGAHQAGIITPAQDRLYFASFDVITDDVDELRRVLAAWTDAAARFTQGLDATPDGAVGGPYLAPPTDTGEALGLQPSQLTVTFGVGATLFETADGDDRLGFAERRPAGLVELPHFATDNLDPARSGGDLCVQACANDPQVAFHAVRNLARIGFGVVSLRWTQLGFGRTSSTSTTQSTPRNLFGFKDGTNNLKAEEEAAIDEFVWVHPDDESGAASWMVGGSYLVARRIGMQIETWDRTSLAEQETVTGRTKGSGAPLSGGEEFTDPDFELAGRDGPLIDPNSHVALAHPHNNGGARMLRRGYNFTDGSNALGRLDSGLFFIAFVRNVETQFTAIQSKLATNDLMTEYLVHTGSAVFAVPPGVSSPGQSVFDPLFT